MNIALLKELCEVAGAPGHESRIREIVLRELKGLQLEISTDKVGNVTALRRGKEDKKVMVAAHMDEIGFIITHIDDHGFLKFITLGGFDPKTLTAQRVIVHGKKDIIGVMGCKPIHIMSPEERTKTAQLGDYFIDLGLPKKEVEKLVTIGDVVTRDRELIEMGNCVNCKSIDNRVSVFILIETLKKLSKKIRRCLKLKMIIIIGIDVQLHFQNAIQNTRNHQCLAICLWDYWYMLLLKTIITLYQY